MYVVAVVAHAVAHVVVVQTVVVVVQPVVVVVQPVVYLPVAEAVVLVLTDVVAEVAHAERARVPHRQSCPADQS